ncbi:hypothetical protein VTK73DRAFT_8034 [Phialemonium thermophilum]|uniref:Glutathione S-transferase n=1 Tax=Phialemonium thermophilum TaxID=223376 RepID=A0ABR3WB44_9PEZI
MNSSRPAMSEDLKPFELYYRGPSPNPWKVAIVLEELGLPWKFVEVQADELKKEPYLSLNPNGRVPALVDPNKSITLWESGAIIDYLIAEYDASAKLHYPRTAATLVPSYQTRCWEHFQMSGQGPYFGQKNWFSYAHPEKLPSAIERYANEIRRVTGVLDAHLAKHGTPFLVGDRATYADLMFVPYYKSVPFVIAPEIDLAEYRTFYAWLERLYARPAVAQVMGEWERQMVAALATRKSQKEEAAATAGKTE